jgi:phage tail-like protein
MSSNTALALLKTEFPDGTEQVVPIEKESFDLGRSAKNDVTLPHPLVSRHHARLLVEGDRVSLIDLGSSNGTFVGEIHLSPNEPYTLPYGKPFRIGPYTLRVEPAPVADAQPEIEPAPADRVDVEQEGASPSPPAEPAVRIGVTEAPPPPPPPAEPPSENGRPSYDEAFGLLIEKSRYLQYLPPIFHEQPFLGHFLLAFEGVFLPIEQIVDNFDLYLDPHTAPPSFLDQLARWLDLTLDEKWPLEKRRAVVAEAAALYHRRGTRWTLSRFLEIYTGAVPEIIEPEDEPFFFRVVLRVPLGHDVDYTTVERIIQANKPAHTTYSLEIRRDGKR